MRRRWKIAVCVIILLGIGCATPATRHNINRVWETNYDFDSLWDGVISFFAGNNIPIKTLEKDSGIIISEWIVLSREDGRDLDCGQPGIAMAYEKYGKFTITIRPAGSQRQILVNSQYQQRRVWDRRDFYATCYSKGTLEHKIKEFIISNAAAKK